MECVDVSSVVTGTKDIDFGIILMRKNRKKIAIFIPSLGAERVKAVSFLGGGAERVMVSLANAFADKGFSVDLVIVAANGPYIKEVANNVRIVDLNKSRVMYGLIPLVRYLRREKPHSLLSALSHANLIAIIARKLAFSKTVLVISERNSLTSYAKGLRNRILMALMRWCYPFADKIVAVSHDIAKELEANINIKKTKITSISNAVDTNSINQKGRLLPMHKWLNDKQTPVILAVGRLEPQKDYKTLLEAFALVCSQVDARLIILGEGSQRLQLQQQIVELELTNRVELAGFKENPFPFMKACDVFVMSSRSEGFPNVLVQAMACGAKIVSTDCPTGPNEILENGSWGRLAPVGDAEALANSIIDSLKDQNPPDVFLRAKFYNVDRVVNEYLEILVKN